MVKRIAATLLLALLTAVILGAGPASATPPQPTVAASSPTDTVPPAIAPLVGAIEGLAPPVYAFFKQNQPLFDGFAQGISDAMCGVLTSLHAACR